VKNISIRARVGVSLNIELMSSIFLFLSKSIKTFFIIYIIVTTTLYILLNKLILYKSKTSISEAKY
jgi:hypothetical protein